MDEVLLLSILMEWNLKERETVFDPTLSLRQLLFEIYSKFGPSCDLLGFEALVFVLLLGLQKHTRVVDTFAPKKCSF
jgi:hypothetical protein